MSVVIQKKKYDSIKIVIINKTWLKLTEKIGGRYPVTYKISGRINLITKSKHHKRSEFLRFELLQTSHDFPRTYGAFLLDRNDLSGGNKSMLIGAERSSSGFHVAYYDKPTEMKKLKLRRTIFDSCSASIH